MDSFTSKAPLTVGGATYEINRLDAVAGLEKRDRLSGELVENHARGRHDVFRIGA